MPEQPRTGESERTADARRAGAAGGLATTASAALASIAVSLGANWRVVAVTATSALVLAALAVVAFRRKLGLSAPKSARSTGSAWAHDAYAGDRLGELLQELANIRTQDVLIEPPPMNQVRKELVGFAKAAGPDAYLRHEDRFDALIDNYVLECRYRSRSMYEGILGQLRELRITTSSQVARVRAQERVAQERLANFRLNMIAAHDQAAKVVQPVNIRRRADAAGIDGGAVGTTSVRRMVQAQAGQLSSLAGTSWVNILHWGVLAVAAAASIATYYEVFAVALYGIPQPVVWVGVVALTTAALTLAHLTGQRVREHRDPDANRRRYSVFRSTGVWPFLGVWVCLGILAFVVRLLASPRSIGTETSIDGVAIGTHISSALLPALLFLSLYFATGVVAAGGGYRLNTAAARDFRVWSRQQSAARKECVELAEETVRAEELLEAIDAEVRRREKAWENVEPSWTAYTELLKAEARLWSFFEP